MACPGDCTTCCASYTLVVSGSADFNRTQVLLNNQGLGECQYTTSVDVDGLYNYLYCTAGLWHLMLQDNGVAGCSIEFLNDTAGQSCPPTSGWYLNTGSVCSECVCDGMDYVDAVATLTPSTDCCTIFDNFNRANSAVTLGSTSTGSIAWSVSGGVWGITSNKAYCVSNTGLNPVAEAIAFINAAGVTDPDVSVTCVGSAPYGPGLAAKYADENNYIGVGIAANTYFPATSLILYSNVSGVFSIIDEVEFALGTDDRLRLVCYGATASAYVNGVPVCTGAIPGGLSSNTKVGILDIDTTSGTQYEDFCVRQVATAVTVTIDGKMFLVF